MRFGTSIGLGVGFMEVFMSRLIPRLRALSARLRELFILLNKGFGLGGLGLVDWVWWIWFGGLGLRDGACMLGREVTNMK